MGKDALTGIKSGLIYGLLLTANQKGPAMQNPQIIAAISKVPKGANVYVVWERPAKLRAKFKGLPLFKKTTMLLRLGVPYDRIQTVKNGRQDGTLPAVNQGLKGKVWYSFPTLKKSLKTGKLLLSVQLAQVFGNESHAATSEWIVRSDGKETTVEKDDYAHMLLGSETHSGDMPQTFDLTAENVLSINGVTAETLENEAEDEAETA
jgi:hypothetical protein